MASHLTHPKYPRDTTHRAEMLQIKQPHRNPMEPPRWCCIQNTHSNGEVIAELDVSASLQSRTWTTLDEIETKTMVVSYKFAHHLFVQTLFLKNCGCGKNERNIHIVSAGYASSYIDHALNGAAAS